MVTPVIPEEGKQTQLVVKQVLGDSITGIYLFGSAVAGGLRIDSDVDVLVAVKDSLTFSSRQVLVDRLLKVSGAVGNAQSIRPVELTIVKVSDVVPWRYPPRSEFVYGEWLRKEYEEGFVPEAAYDPDLVIVLKKVIDHGLPMYGDKAADLFEPVAAADICRAIRELLPKVLKGFDGDERNVILTLARMWRTVTTGDIVSKDKAADWAMRQLTEEHASLLNKARLGYLGKIDDRWSGRRDQAVMLLRHMKRGVEDCLDSRP
ncbi:MAG: DUF4111 domain-containing protein [Desulfobacterales bacterium]|nr:DUF4111 domain-containing protein [Desulfobacterales bacterium]